MRLIHEIASDIRQDWKNVHYSAQPYLQAMEWLDEPTDWFYQDSARTIIIYFLSNATTWKGEVAREIKKELKQLIK